MRMSMQAGGSKVGGLNRSQNVEVAQCMSLTSKSGAWRHKKLSELSYVVPVVFIYIVLFLHVKSGECCVTVFPGREHPQTPLNKERVKVKVKI